MCGRRMQSSIGSSAIWSAWKSTSLETLTGPSGTIVSMWQTRAHRSCNLQGQMDATRAVDLGTGTRKYEADRGLCGRNGGKRKIRGR